MRIHATTGSAVYGVSTVTIDGTAPAALAGRSVGIPAWFNTAGTQLVFLDGGVAGVGPWVIRRLTLPATLALQDAASASIIRAGGGTWAAQGATGVRTNASVGPFASATLADVSPAGDVVIITNGATNAGLEVYTAAGALTFALTTVQVVPTSVRLRGDILAYQDLAGAWHLVDITTAVPPTGWCPRLDGVTQVIPLFIASILYVVEIAGTVTMRRADSNQAWVLSSTPGLVSLDAVAYGAGARAGACTDSLESASSLVLWDVVRNGSDNTADVATGTIVAGAVSFATAVETSPTQVVVGPPESLEPGQTVVSSSEFPFRQPLLDPKSNLLNREVQHWFRNVDAALATIQETIDATPKAIPGIALPGFNKISTAGEPDIVAGPAAQTLTFTSSDGSITYVFDPNGKLIDMTSTGGGTPGGADGSVQYNDGGAFGGFGFWDDVLGHLELTRIGGSDVLSLLPEGFAPGEGQISFDPGPPGPATGSGYQQMGMGMDDYVATDDLPGYFWKSILGLPSDGGGFEMLPGETLGNPLIYAQGIGFGIFLDSGFYAYVYGMGTGAVPGSMIAARESGDGAGAAGTLGLYDRVAVPAYFWVDANGVFRMGPDRPLEDDSVNDTSGNVIPQVIGAAAAGNMAVFDANDNLVDGGIPTVGPTVFWPSMLMMGA